MIGQSKRWMTLVSAGVALLVVVTTAEASQPGAKPGAGKVVVGVDQDPASLDPSGNMLSFTAFSVANAIYDPLFSVPFGQPPKPALAESVTEAPDRKSWTLKLKPNITFQDGTKFDADAVVFNIERQRKSQLNANAMSILTEVVKVDPLTVKLSVAKPFVPMAYLLSQGRNLGLMVSPAVAGKGALARDPAGAGTGPYVFKEWVPGDHITVVRNPSYWGTPKPRLDQIVYKVVPDENARLAALRAGDLQSMTSVLPETANSAKGAGLSVVVPPFAGYGTVLFNNLRPPLDDVRVRRALALAIDSKTLSTFLKDPNYDQRGFGLWPKNNPWYVAPDKKFTYDPAAAKALIAAYAKDKGPVKFTFLNSSTSTQGSDTVKLIVKNWQDAGVQVTSKQEPDGNAFVLDIVFGSYEAAGFVTGLADDPDATAYSVLHSTSSFNFEKYKSPEMDAALDEGRSNPNPAARKAAYAKVQQIFRRDVPFLIGSPATVRVISNPKLCGIEPSGFFPAKTVGLSC